MSTPKPEVKPTEVARDHTHRPAIEQGRWDGRHRRSRYHVRCEDAPGRCGELHRARLNRSHKCVNALQHVSKRYKLRYALP